MKKSLLFSFLALCALMLFASCATLPKKVKPGDSLVIGRVEINVHDYGTFDGVNLNETDISEVELVLKDVIYGKEKIIRPNKDGFLYITGLTPHRTYAFTHLKFSVVANDGHGGIFNTDLPQIRSFIAYDNIIVNIGCTSFDYNGAKSWVSWKTSNYYYVKENFESLDEESEWFDKEILEQR